jgi:hypothetical protein
MKGAKLASTAKKEDIDIQNATAASAHFGACPGPRRLPAVPQPQAPSPCLPDVRYVPRA